MKNKILMISTFFLSFVILISSVNAAQELTCTYEDASEPNDSLGIVYKKRIIQYEDGTIKYQYFADSGIAVSHLYNWKNSDNPNTSFKDTSAYDKNSGLKECPQCVTWKNNYNKPDNDKFHFKDANKEGNCNGEFLDPKYAKLEKQENTALSDDESCKEFEHKDQVEGNWLSVCEYNNGDNKTYLYFNNTTYTIQYKDDSKTVNSCIVYSELNKVYEKNKNQCPAFLYYQSKDDKISYYLNDPIKGSKMQLQYQTDYDESGNVIKDRDNIKTNTDPEPTSCEDLFSDELIEKINKVMNIIRIAVPIILVVFGMTDFLRATFSDSEDNMKKDRDRFIKRILAAIIVFLVPIFVDLVLRVSNVVWSNINPDTCIK